VGDYGIATVLDWGAAKVLTTSEPRSNNLSEEHLESLMLGVASEPLKHPKSDLDTVFGTVMGTPNFLAPEQARGEVVDYRADVFALDGILCHLLTGSPTFVGNKLFKVYQKSVAGDLSYAFDQLDRCGAPIPLVHLAKRCLEPNVTSRPKDGQYISLEWTARSVEDEGVIYAVARDVSERIRLEEEKLRVEADCFRLSEIVDLAGDAIVGKNLDGVI